MDYLTSEILSNGTLAAWVSVVVSALLAIWGFWSSDRKRDGLLKDIEIYNAWYENGDDKELSKLFYRIDAELKDMLEDPFVTPVFVFQIVWGILLVVFGVIDCFFKPEYALQFIMIGVATIALFVAFRMIDRTKELKEHSEKLIEWKRREAKKREGGRQE